MVPDRNWDENLSKRQWLNKYMEYSSKIGKGSKNMVLILDLHETIEQLYMVKKCALIW